MGLQTPKAKMKINTTKFNKKECLDIIGENLTLEALNIIVRLSEIPSASEKLVAKEKLIFSSIKLGII